MSTTTLSFRRSSFVTSPPIAGAFVQSKSGKSVLRIVKTTMFRRAGEVAGRDTIRLVVDRMPKGAATNGAIILPWPIADKVLPTPPVPAAARFREVVAAVAMVNATRSRKQIKRDNARTLLSRMADLESPVPSRQRNAVLDGEGRVVAPPRVVNGTWRDPDDTNVRSRTPKLVHGNKPYDPIRTLARDNPSVDQAHVVASDCYRLAFELGPEAGVRGGRDLIFSDRSFGGGSCPTDLQIDHMQAWRFVQDKFPPRAQQALQVVVLDRTCVTTWADAIDGNRQKWVGYLVGVLDQLLYIYQDDVDSFLQRERVSLD